MYKIALISDIHFGCRNNSEKYLKISEDFFLNTLFNIIKEQDITDLRILGDLFDNRNSINVRTLNTVLNIFRIYNEEFPNLKIKCLIGNHDLYYHNRVDINSLESIRQFSNVEIIKNVQKEVIKNKSIVMVPWITSKTCEVYENFNYYCTGNEKIDYLFGHFEINNFEIMPGIKFEGGLNSSMFKNFTKVISGHFHTRNEDNKIKYLGCPYELTWSDYGNQKGVHILDIETDELQFIKNDDSPYHMRVYLSDIAKNKKKPQEVKNILLQCKNNIVRLVIDQKYRDSSIVKIINQIESLNPIKLDVDNQYIDQIEFDVNAENNLKDLNDPLSFLLEYCKNLHFEELEENEVNEMYNKLKDIYSISIKEND